MAKIVRVPRQREYFEEIASMNAPIENVPLRSSAHPFAPSPQRNLVKAANQCLAARLRAHAIMLALLFGAASAAAAEGFTIGGTGAALGTMKLLASEFRAGHPDIAVTTLPSLGSRGGIKAVLDGVTGLAVAAAAARALASDQPESTAVTSPTPGVEGGRRILYLDDDESLVFLVTRLLERRGFRVSGFIDQRQALDALRADPAAFNLMVTDYNMPGMSGLDVVRAARAIRADLPVAIASGFIDEALRAEADGAGVHELIFKANAVEDMCEAFARLALSVGSGSTCS